MVLSAQALSDLYSQIEYKSNDDIKRLIEASIAPAPNQSSATTINRDSIPAAYRNRPQISFTGRNGRYTFDVVIEICIQYFAKFSEQIKDIMKKNPQATNFVLDIIQLMAPAIAYEHSNLKGMAIVGAITLLCRQGISNYLQ